MAKFWNSSTARLVAASACAVLISLWIFDGEWVGNENVISNKILVFN